MVMSTLSSEGVGVGGFARAGHCGKRILVGLLYLDKKRLGVVAVGTKELLTGRMVLEMLPFRLRRAFSRILSEKTPEGLLYESVHLGIPFLREQGASSSPYLVVLEKCSTG